MISTQSLTLDTPERREFTVKCSFVQIYNEQILDLFNPSHLKTVPSSTNSGRPDSKRASRLDTKSGANTVGLKLRWSAASEFYVENLRVLECQTPEQVLRHFHDGVKHKVMASHRLNAASSRSHCVFTIYVESFDPSASPHDVLQSKLALVDLAGSERVDKTGATGVTLQESIGINKSLFVLRQVIQALSDESASAAAYEAKARPRDAHRSDRAYIPFRDSKLTSLLKYSLGGNSLTLMIACLSPSDRHADENLSTLVYASKAQCIANKPTKNEDPKTALIHELRQEVDALRAQLAQAQDVILSFQHLPSERRGDAGNQVVLREECSERERGPDTPSQARSEARARKDPKMPLSSTPSTVMPKATPGVVGIEGSATTRKLKMSVIDNVEMIKQLYATEKALTERVRLHGRRVEDLEYETRVLNVENQSLREKLEVLEYLLAGSSQQGAGSTMGDPSASDNNNGCEPEDCETIPGYGALATSASLPRVGVAPPAAERVREALRRTRHRMSVSSRGSDRDGSAVPSNQSGSVRYSETKPSKPKRKDLDTGLLSVSWLSQCVYRLVVLTHECCSQLWCAVLQLSELKELLSGAKQSRPDSNHRDRTVHAGSRPGRTIVAGAVPTTQSPPAPPHPALKHSTSSAGACPRASKAFYLQPWV